MLNLGPAIREALIELLAVVAVVAGLIGFGLAKLL